MNNLKKYLPSVFFLLIFETVAVTLWLTKDNIFYQKAQREYPHFKFAEVN